MKKNKVNIFVIFFLIGVLTLFFACATSGINSLTQTYSAPRELIWKGMVRALAKEYISFADVIAHPPTLVTKPLYVDKQFGVDKTVYIATASLTGFSRPYAVDVIVKKYPNYEIHPEIFTVDLDKASIILEDIRNFIKKERFNFSIKDQFTPY